MEIDDPKRGQRDWRQICHRVWAFVGVLVLVVAAVSVVRHVSLIVVPLILALFPATLLIPVARRLEQGRVPRPLAALICLVAGLLALIGIGVGTITLVVAELPEIVDSAGEGVDRLEETVRSVVPGFTFPGVDEIGGMIRDRIAKPDEEGEGTPNGDLAMQGLNAARSALEVLTGAGLMVVILFFYLQGGRSLASGFIHFATPRHGERVMALGAEAWKTLGAYFRGQLLVALFDAVFIGVGLLLLSVPLAFPLAVIVFFGGLFPIVGAITTGILAVLVGFSAGGLWTGLAVSALVLTVQQVESNVLEPLILSNVINLRPLTVLLSITLGALVLGVLGAFLAVPAFAIVKQLIVEMRQSEADGLITTS